MCIRDRYNSENSLGLGVGATTTSILTVKGNVDVDVDGKEFKIGDTNATKSASQFTVDGISTFTGKSIFQSVTNPTSLSSDAGVEVTGGMTIAKKLYVGEDVLIGPDSNTNISLFASTGNVTIDGQLTVGGSTSFTSLTITNLTVNTSLNLGANVNFAINTNKFTVESSSGNTVLGKLEVTDTTSPNLTLSTFSSACLLYTSPSPRDRTRSRMPSSA